MPASGGGYDKGLGANHSLPLICTPSNCIPVLFLPPDHLFQPLRKQQGRIVVYHAHFAAPSLWSLALAGQDCLWGKLDKTPVLFPRFLWNQRRRGLVEDSKHA